MQVAIDTALAVGVAKGPVSANALVIIDPGECEMNGVAGFRVICIQIGRAQDKVAPLEPHAVQQMLNFIPKCSLVELELERIGPLCLVIRGKRFYHAPPC